MSFWGLAQLVISTVIFLLAAIAAKQWGLAPSPGKILLTLALYTAGNLMMLRLVREFGMLINHGVKRPLVTFAASIRDARAQLAPEKA